MLHKYRKTGFIEAEQFDGSDEMINEYWLKHYGPDTYVLPNDYNFTPIKIGTYIATDIDNPPLFRRAIAPDIFERTYERVD